MTSKATSASRRRSCRSYGLVCVNGHAMDDGYLECPCCGAYRPSGCLREGMTHTQQMAAIRRALAAEQRAAQRVAREYGILLPRYADSGLHHEAAS